MGLMEVEALVTSDGVGTHVVSPGTPVFGVNLDGVVKIGFLPAFETDGPISNSGTGSLISDTHVLTSAHVADKGPFLYYVQFDLADGPVRIPVTGYAIHPNYVPGGSINDIAILELASPAPAGVPRYELHTGTTEVGSTMVLSGYGRTGSGATGSIPSDGKKRVGLNRIEATGDTIALQFGDPLFNATQLLCDFDSGEAANDITSLLGPGNLGFGDDEVGLGAGDSGGPGFIAGQDGIYRVAGVNQFVTGVGLEALGNFDIDDVDNNSTWGEIFATSRVSFNLVFIADALAGNLNRLRILNDGGVHVVENTLGGNTVFQVEDSSEGGTSTLNINTGGLLRGSNLVDAPALLIKGGSLGNMSDGLIEGYPAVRLEENARFIVSGGAINAFPSAGPIFDSNSVGVRAWGDSVFTISGGTIQGQVSAFTALSNSRVFVSGGSFTGGSSAARINSMAEIENGSFTSAELGISAEGTGSMLLSGGTFHGDVDGGRTSATSSANISGGTFTGGVTAFRTDTASHAEVSGGNFSGPFAFFATGQSTVKATGGSFTGTNDGFQSGGASSVSIHGGTFIGVSNGLRSELSSRVEIHDGTFSGAYGVWAAAESTVIVDGGTFSGSEAGFIASPNSTVTIRNGSFTGSEDAIQIFETAEVNLRGGTFSGEEVSGVYATDQAKVNVFGGSISGGASDLYVEGTAVVKIFGYNFDRGLGTISGETGSLSGVFFDGTPFEISFERFDDSVIELVSGYDGWAAFHGLTDDQVAMSADANSNNLPNGLELVFGGDPTAPEGVSAILPSLAILTSDVGNGSQDYLKFTFRETQLSIDLEVETTPQYSTDLAADSWLEGSNGLDGVIVFRTPNGFAAGVHKVEVWIPRSLASGGSLFARVSAN